MTEITIDLRSHEREQLSNFVPRTIDELENRGLDDEADDVKALGLVVESATADLTTDSAEGGEIEDEDTVAATSDEWSTLIGALRVLRDEEGLRSWWLRRKLSGRLQGRLREIEEEVEQQIGNDDKTVAA